MAGYLTIALIMKFYEVTGSVKKQHLGRTPQIMCYGESNLIKFHKGKEVSLSYINVLCLPNM